MSTSRTTQHPNPINDCMRQRGRPPTRAYRLARAHYISMN
ncbi:unnamed protein product [Medioppia subpectinata]|uniref:Uncharacterized protein n=1 Tax=Medioppia subpectinata TaxID=1979941 RepID=A0A7R9LZZ0_9ACAR|nr:unnamed protein product [Medioppia subpectinata]CAG2122929.1 unnamed protein product [Medioppia subpectinata]